MVLRVVDDGVGIPETPRRVTGCATWPTGPPGSAASARKRCSTPAMTPLSELLRNEIFHAEAEQTSVLVAEDVLGLTVRKDDTTG